MNLTPTQAAERAGVTTRTIRDWIKSGQLRAWKRNRRLFISAKSLRAMYRPFVPGAQPVVTPTEIPASVRRRLAKHGL